MCEAGHPPGGDSSHSADSSKEILDVWELDLTERLSMRGGPSKALDTCTDGTHTFKTLEKFEKKC